VLGGHASLRHVDGSIDELVRIAGNPADPDQRIVVEAFAHGSPTLLIARFALEHDQLTDRGDIRGIQHVLGNLNGRHDALLDLQVDRTLGSPILRITR
jgi:hypothetical protein